MDIKIPPMGSLPKDLRESPEDIYIKLMTKTSIKLKKYKDLRKMFPTSDFIFIFEG